MLVALLVHPYIMCMVIAVLAAAPLTLLIRRDRTWIPTAGGILGGVAITGVVCFVVRLCACSSGDWLRLFLDESLIADLSEPLTRHS